MVKRWLVTTALEASWSEHHPPLYLGTWCLPHAHARPQTQDIAVLPYHWDDRGTLESDYRSLQALYESLLAELSTRLNVLHGVAHSPRYWRILIGPWLGYFLPILFDRWQSLMQALAQYELAGTTVLECDDDTGVPNDMAEFNQLITEDEWNHKLYAALLRKFTGLPCHTLHAGPGRPRAVATPPRSNLRKLGRFAARALGRLSRDTDAVLMASYLPRFDELRLYWRLGQLPQLWRTPAPHRSAVNPALRDWILDGESGSEFERVARAMVASQLPCVYLEAYQGLQDQVREMHWPSRPRLIWSSNSFVADDVFKAWAAQKAEAGAVIMTGQHGGHFGVGRWNFHEEHDMAISDGYFSWGWTAPKGQTVYPVGMLNGKPGSALSYARQCRALLVAAVHPRYSYWMYSTPVGGQWQQYFDDQFAFVECLPPTIRKALTVRLYPIDFGWNQSARWTERCPDVMIDDGSGKMATLIARSRVYISTYNATTFLESFTLDVPTVIYWREEHWELRDEAIPYFEELKRVGIFHGSPASAAAHLARIWEDVDAWWLSEPVRQVLASFKAQYCKLPPDLLDRIEAVLRDAMAGAEQ